jgi:chromosome segregation ATPase
MSTNTFDSDQPSAVRPATPPIMIGLLVAVACLMGATLYLYLELQNTRARLEPHIEMLQVHEEKLAQLEGSVTRTSREVSSSVEKVLGKVDSAEKELSAKTSQVEKRAMGRAARLSEAIEETKAQQQARFNEVGGNIQELRSTTQQTGTRLGSLTGKVGTVEEKVDQTRQELERTIADLKTVRGDLGVQSGLIATNADELTALRELGERNYFEFDISKAKQASRVGPVTIRLRKADTKRNRFNIDLWADDKRIEKKNKTLLEPVQFYVIGSRQPCELVVNRISKDRIVGYLATPKVQQPRRAATNTSGSE